MNKLDPHSLFSIFEKGDEDVYKEHGQEDLLQNPFVLMGMVLRGLDNFKLMSSLYMKNYPKEFKEVQPTVKYKFFNKLYRYLNRIDINKLESIYTIGDSFDNQNICDSLDELIYYFQGIEHYEKCAKMTTCRFDNMVVSTGTAFDIKMITQLCPKHDY